MNALSPIQRDFDRISHSCVVEARKFQTAVLADLAGRRGALDSRITPLGHHMKLAGPALTVEVRPGDNLMFHAALAIAKPGDVIVVDGKGDISAALCGAIMSAEANAAGIAGFVVFGAVRDSEELHSGSFPIFSIGTNPNGPTRSLPGRINCPISVAGVSVNPGDLVVGDRDGVVVLSKDEVSGVLSKAQHKLDSEAVRFEAIANGNLQPEWLESSLNILGLTLETDL